VKLIHHDEFMSEEAIPTFDSRAIECNLWKIDGLSEQFIYFNDDVYIMRPMPKKAFFQEITSNYEKPIVWVSKTVPSEWKYSLCPYRKSWFRLASCFRGCRLLHHVPASMTKSILERAGCYFGDAWSRTSKSRVRTIDTVPPFGAAINLAIKDHAVVVDKLPATLMKEAVIKPATVLVLLSKHAFFLCVNRQPFDKTKVFCDEMRRYLLTPLEIEDLKIQ
jgi:hypothetical protein